MFELHTKKRWMSAHEDGRCTATGAVLPALKRRFVGLRLCAQARAVYKIIMDETEQRKGGESKASCC